MRNMHVLWLSCYRAAQSSGPTGVFERFILLGAEYKSRSKETKVPVFMRLLMFH